MLNASSRRHLMDLFSFFFFLCIGHRPWCVNGNRIRDATFNAEDGFVKFYLRGRPVIVYAPSPLLDSYNLSKINMAPQARLKMEWVYPFLAMLYTYTRNLFTTLLHNSTQTLQFYQTLHNFNTTIHNYTTNKTTHNY